MKTTILGTTMLIAFAACQGQQPGPANFIAKTNYLVCDTKPGETDCPLIEVDVRPSTGNASCEVHFPYNVYLVSPATTVPIWQRTIAFQVPPHFRFADPGMILDSQGAQHWALALKPDRILEVTRTDTSMESADCFQLNIVPDSGVSCRVVDPIIGNGAYHLALDISDDATRNPPAISACHASAHR